MAKQTFTTGDVLTAAAMTSLQQTAMGGGSTTAKTASYTLVAADAGTVVQMNSASATTITVNTALFAAGDTVQIQNIGAGVCTVTAGTATVNTAGSLALSQYENGTLYFTATSASLFFDTFQAGGASGLTFINRTTFSATAEATIETVFTTAYDTYLVIVESMTATTGTDNGQLRMRRNTTASTSGIYGMLTSAKYNDTAIQFTGKTNSDAIDISTYTDGLSAALWFNNVGTGTSVTARAHGTSVNPAQGENGTIGFTCADAQNWNGFSLRSASSNVSGAVTTYGLAKS